MKTTLAESHTGPNTARNTTLYTAFISLNSTGIYYFSVELKDVTFYKWI